MFKNRDLRFNGFTLIELMIVITIIAVLLAILLPNISHSRQQAMLSSCESNERNLQAGLEIYNTQYKRYPADLNAIFPHYMKKPYCPTNKSEYGYTPSADGSSFTIYCQGLHYIGLGEIEEGYPQYTPVSGLRLNSKADKAQQ